MSDLVTFRISFTLDRSEMISALCWSRRNEDAAEALPDLSNTKVTEIIRDTLYWAGAENYGYWGDYRSERDAALMEAWAAALVDRAYPALTAPQ